MRVDFLEEKVGTEEQLKEVNATYLPSLKEIKKLADQGNTIPVYREIDAKMETPVSAYLKVARPPHSFLLESVEGGEQIARYSFIGTEPYDVIKTGPGESHGDIDPLKLIEEALSPVKFIWTSDRQRFNGGAVGYISYDTVRHFERLPTPKDDPLGLPEAVFMLTATYLIFDHMRHKIRVVSHAILDRGIEVAYQEAINRIDDLVHRLASPLKASRDREMRLEEEIGSNISRRRFEEMVGIVKDYITAGDVIQTVVAQRISRPTYADPFQIYCALRTINPSPYMYFMNLEDYQIVGASPELLVQLQDGEVATHPIAGTRPRGSDANEDEALENELRTDEKECAEHIMLVDLGRNDIGRVAEPGTVEVTQLMDVERYSHVMHLVSHVTGKLRSGYTAFDALRACFPAGTVSGAPKIRAMEIIAELEPDRRGPYAGAVGYFDFAGNMDTAITIRTAVIRDNVAYIQAGGGIVHDSTPENEYQESLHKASALLRAIDEAENSSSQ